jgi:hypothetical protein
MRWKWKRKALDEGIDEARRWPGTRVLPLSMSLENALEAKWHAAKRMRITYLKSDWGVAGTEAEGWSLGSVMEKGFDVQHISDWFDDKKIMSAEKENDEDWFSLIFHLRWSRSSCKTPFVEKVGARLL